MPMSLLMKCKYVHVLILLYPYFRPSAASLTMERLEKFQIIFNNPTATYSVGDTVYGYGWVILKEPIFVQSRYIMNNNLKHKI